MKLDFFEKQLLIDEFSEQLQKNIFSTKCLVIGAGGIAHPLLTYLASTGFGDISIADGDKVELSNLHRQFHFNANDLNKGKAEVLKEKLKNEYEFVNIRSINKFLEEKDLFELIEHHDLIFDASDNFETRYISNDICHEHKKPLISGAAEGMIGIVAAFNFKENSPCYECLFPRNYSLNENTCENSGITPSVLGIIGSFMVSIALKIISDETFKSSIMRINLSDLTLSQPKLRKDKFCKICGENIKC